MKINIDFFALDMVILSTKEIHEKYGVEINTIRKYKDRINYILDKGTDEELEKLCTEIERDHHVQPSLFNQEDKLP